MYIFYTNLNEYRSLIDQRKRCQNCFCSFPYVVMLVSCFASISQTNIKPKM